MKAIRTLTVLAVAGAFGLGLYGCSPATYQSNLQAQETVGEATPRVRALEVKTGVQLWGENCIRCHNAPPPAAFSDAEWEIITHHMRVRANLTEEEVQKIRAFLISSN